MNPKNIAINTILLLTLTGCETSSPQTTPTQQPTPHEQSRAWATRYLNDDTHIQITDVKTTSKTTWDARVNGILMHFEATKNHGTVAVGHVPAYSPTEGYR